MKKLVAVLCVSLLSSNSVAMARGTGWSKKAVEMWRGVGGGKLVELSSKGKQLGAGLALAGVLTCGTILSCSNDELANTLPQPASRVATLNYQHSASLDEIVAGLEQVEGAQIGVVTSAGQGALTVETEAGTVYLQLAEGEMLINNSETPLKVTLSEEPVASGLIAEGSWIAVIPAVAVAGAGLVLTGMAVAGTLVDPYGDDSGWLAATATALAGGLLTATTTVGTYHLLVLL